MWGTRYNGRQEPGRRSRFEIIALLLGLALIVSQAIGVVGASAGTSRDRTGTFKSDTTKVSSQDNARDRSGSFSSDTTKVSPDGTSVASRTRSGNKLAPAALTGSNVSVDLVAAGPGTYNHVTLAGTGPDLPRYANRTINKNTGVVESLEGGDFKCGDNVVFFAYVTAVGGSGSGTLEMDMSFLSEPTGQPGVGFDDIVSASINTQDDAAGGANVRDGGETVTLSNEHTGTLGGKDAIIGTVTLTDLDAGEAIVIRVVGHLGCDPGSSPTGNLQVAVDSAKLDNDKLSIGQQTVPFKKVEDIALPGINIVKTADAGDPNESQDPVPAGSQIGFTITVTNGGNVAVSNVSVTDQFPTGTGIDWSIDSTSGDTNGLSCSLSAAELMTCAKSSPLGAGASFSVHVVSNTTGDSCAPYNNTASVTASPSLSDSDDASIVVDGCNVNLTLDKSADAQSVNAGDSFTFTIDVSNTGNATAENVHVTDSMPAGVSIDSATFTGGSNGPGTCDVTGQDIDCDLGTLAAGASAQVTIDVTVDDSNCPSVTNNASASADNETGSTEDNSDSVTVGVTCAVGVTVVKSNDADTDDEFNDTETAGSAGQAVNFEVVITNNSQVPVTITSLTDAWPGHDASDLVCDDGEGGFDPVGTELAPGGSLICHFTESDYAPAAGDSLTNTVVVAVESTSGSAGDSDTSTVNTPGTPPPPPPPSPLGIQIIKSGPALAHVGDTITYTFDVSLTTSTPLTNITVTDPICSAAPTLDSKSGGDQDEWLESGETWHYSCKHDISNADPDPLPNTATVSGTDSKGRNTSDTDDHLVDVIHPAIKIVKTADPTSIAPGETVTYTYKVTNIGDVTLYNVSVDDDKLGHICDIAQLDVGESETCTKDFTAGEKNLGPLDNVAVAKGKDETGYPVRDDDKASIDVVLGTTVTPPPTSTPPSGTAFTGSTVLPLGAVALVFLVIGTGLIYLGRRREDGSEA